MNIAERLDDPVDEFLKFFSAERIEKILRYKFNSDRNRSVFAELLAKKLIAEKTGKNFIDVKIFRDDEGRPYCEEPEIYFSLSHSGAWVACSIGDSRNGIDIEILNRKVDFRIAKRFFLPSEFAILESLDGIEREKKFFEFWTLKEACLKCFGLREWSNVDCEKLIRDGQGRNFNLPGAIVGVCCEKVEMPEKIFMLN